MKEQVSVIYVDDNAIELARFEKICGEVPEIKLERTYSDAAKALEYCKKARPDLALVDIRMQQRDGFWMGAELTRLDIPYAFLSGDEGFALKAFQHSALHYLVKPVSGAKIRDLLSRYRQLQHSFSSPAPGEERETKRIYINTQKQILIIQLNEVVYLQANGAYTIFHMLVGQTLMSGKNLGKYAEQVLRNSDFAKIHRSYIINQAYLVSISKRKMELTFEFKNGMQIRVATFRREEWMNSLL